MTKSEFVANTTPTPNFILDHWMPILGYGELKILLCIIRKTYGWHKRFDRIAYSQIEKQTGLARKNIAPNIIKLEERGLIKVKRSETEGGDSDVSYYKIINILPSENVGTQSNHVEEEVGTQSNHGGNSALPKVGTQSTQQKTKTKPTIQKNNDHCSNGEKSSDFWLNTLDPTEQEAFNKLIKRVPEWGDKVDPKTLTYWLKTWKAVRTEEAYQLYYERSDEVKKTNSTPIASMGGYIRNALDKDLKPKDENFQKNMELASKYARKYDFIEPMKRYCKFVKGGLTDELYYNISSSAFGDALVSRIKTFSDI